MSSVHSKTKKERLSFFVNQDLSKKIYRVSEQTNQTVSELARQALKEYLERIEKEKIEQELENGYKANYDYYLRFQEEWNYADK